MHYFNDPKISSNDVQTLANSIIGTSILAMPFCFAKCGIILSICLLIISTAITRACCNYLIKASIVTRRRNIESLGFYVFGESGKALVEISVIGFLMGTCVAFFVVIGDLCPILVSKLFNIQNTSSLRLWMIIVTTFVCIIPLSFQQSIKSLSFVCKASIAFYICLTLKTVLESFSTFRNDDHWASNIELWNLSGVLQCIPVFSMAMSCQIQLFEVYENISSFDRCRQNIYHATSICLVVYTIIGFFGYVAFYNESLSGNILVNFKPSLSNDIITFGFILSIACSFPLVIFPCRTSLNSLLQKSKIHHHAEILPYIPESRQKPLTLFIIFSTMIIGILIPSVEVIIGIVGSTIGVLICVLFPATCFIKIMQRNSGEKCIAQLVIVIGLIIMILGTYSNLMALDKPKSGPPLAENNEPIIVNIPPPAPVVIDLPESIVKKNSSSEKISEDGIKKEELEMAAISVAPVAKDVHQEIKEKDNEIKELKESKNKLEQEVKEIKQELVKQNKETQQLVLQKFEEIAEKVDKIQSDKDNEGNVRKSVENDVVVKKIEVDNKAENVDKKEIDILAEGKLKVDEKIQNGKERKIDEVKIDKVQSEKPKENQIIKEIKVEEPKQPEDELMSVVDLLLENGKSVINEPTAEEKKVSKNPKENVQEIDLKPLAVAKEEVERPEKKEKREPQKKAVMADPIVQHIVQKSQEPLSYQVGEKIMEEKKRNLTISENADNKSQNEVAASQEEFKNEMRRKRFAEEVDLLPSDALDLQLKSILTIGRDLKAVNDEN